MNRPVKVLLGLTIILVTGGLAKEKPFKVKSVTFEGNQTYKKAILHKVLIQRPSQFLAPVYYESEILDSDLDALGEFYRQRGFLDFQLIDHSVSIDSTERGVYIQITVEEGPRTYLETVDLIGNTVFPDSLLRRVMLLKSGDPLDADKIRQANLKLLRHYADRGYLDASIDPFWRLNPEGNLAMLDFTIQEGPEVFIGGIEIQGLDKTRERIVRRELLFDSGDRANYSTLLRTQRELYLTGLFESVFIDPQFEDEADSSLRSIRIEVAELQAGSFDISVGYGTVDRARVKLAFLQNNLAGTARKIGLIARISTIQRLLELSYTNPRIWDSRWRTDTNLKREFQYQPAYNLSTYGVRLAIRRNLTRNWAATLALRNEANELSNVSVDSVENLDDADVHSIRGRVGYDSRNNLFNPTAGFLAEIDHEFAGGPFQGANNFHRTTFRFAMYRHMVRKSVLASGLEISLLYGRTDTRVVSLNERLYAGGPNSIRGYGYRLVGPKDAQGVPKGGLLKIVWNAAEWRIPVVKSIQLAPFVDAGNVWNSAFDFDLKDIKIGGGLGIHYNSPVGILRIDLAYPLNPFKGISGLIPTFSLGYAF